MQHVDSDAATTFSHQISQLYRTISPRSHSKLVFTTLTPKCDLIICCLWKMANSCKTLSSFTLSFLILILSSFQKNWTSTEMQMTKKVLMLQNLLTMDYHQHYHLTFLNFIKLKICAESTVEVSLEQTHVIICDRICINHPYAAN